MSTFSGLHTGLSSLYAQRRALELTGHNIANANTEGYSRQRVDLEANGGPSVPALHSRWTEAGNGVTVAGVERLRDQFLESRALRERGDLAALTGDRVLLGRVEAVLSEPGDSGIQAQLADYWSGWDDVANKPDSLAARSQLIERAETLASGLNGARERLATQWSASQEQLTATVQDVNSVSAGVADFNRAILDATNAGLVTNDLADKRDLLVQRLGELAGVTVKPSAGEPGSVDVLLNGESLVKGDVARRLKVEGGTTLALPATPVTVTWEDPASPKGPGTGPAKVGGAAGSLQHGLNDVLPRYSGQLRSMAVGVSEQVNAVHTLAYDQDGQDGAPFFRIEGDRLVVQVLDPRKVAASASYAVNDDGTRRGDRGGARAAQLAELSTTTGGPDDLYRKTVVGLGVEAQAAGRRVDIQTSILAQVDASREAQAGVNLDEEMTNMLAFQRAYEGAARFVSAIDQMLDTLINRTGVVGR
jgi:flagellar hook-associated protein 1 FlgK